MKLTCAALSLHLQEQLLNILPNTGGGIPTAEVAGCRVVVLCHFLSNVIPREVLWPAFHNYCPTQAFDVDTTLHCVGW